MAKFGLPSSQAGVVQAESGAAAGSGRLMRIFATKAAAPGEVYGAPGHGNSTAISVITGVVLIVAWFVITNMGWVKPLFLPTPQAVWGKFILASTEGVSNSTLWQHTVASLSRVFGAFFLACVTAIPIGILMGTNRVMRGIFDAPIEFYRPLPPLAYLPLVIIWFGIGEFSKTLLIYLAIFAPMAISARAGVRSVSMEQIHAAYAMGGSRLQIVWHVILKAARRGLGFMVLNAAEFLASDTVIMGIIVIGLFAFGFDLLMRYVERLLIPWKGKV